MIYFTSDLHFCYKKGQCKVGTRVFNSYVEKDEFLIERWNDTVKQEDEVYLLGDVSEGNGTKTNEILRRLNGKKYLVVGNNDRYLEDATFDENLYEWIKQYYELHEMDTKFVLFHYPIEVWSGCRKDRVHLHGHLHRPKAIYKPIRRYEVGVDAHDGRPVSIDEIWETIKNYHNVNMEVEGLF